MANPASDPLNKLSHSQLFQGIPKDYLKDLLNHGKVHKTDKNGSIVMEHEYAGGLHVILEGSVKITKEIPSRKSSQVVTEFGVGSFFGEISVFGLTAMASATATVTAPGGCTTFVITRNELGGWFKRYPEAEVMFLRNLASELCNRLYSTTERLIDG
jgi:CRP-like cAMP-binding protein